jgi:uncharacterized membrane protein YgcG
VLRLALAALLALTAAPLAAQERITAFDSQIAVQRDGSVEVRETIDVVAEGNAIRHGIYRDFPTRYRGRAGNSVRITFTLLGTSLDGRPEPATTETIANGVRIKIGSAEREVSQGPHRYAISYRATREIGRFEGFDELYWNVTGTGWPFAIERASATVTLPAEVAFGKRAFYTGEQGSTQALAEVTDEGPGRIRFATTAPLAPYQGLTIAAAFPKGVVAEPTPASRTGEWLAQHGPPLAGLAGLAGLLAYLYYAWNRVGRDPRQGTVVPLFAPPDGLSPAAMRYIVEQKGDNRGFAAALVDLGVKGHVRLVEQDGGWLAGDTRTIERTASATALLPAEQAMIDALLAPGETIVMEQEQHDKFSSASSALNGVFKKEYEGKLFRRNLAWGFGGVAVLIAALWLAAAAVLLADGDGGAAMLVVVAAAMGLAAAFLLGIVRRSQTVGKCLFGGLGVLLAGGALLVAVPLIPAAFASGNVIPMLIPLIGGVPLTFASLWWISAPTREGRRVLDSIAGFKQYLSITEGERLDRMTEGADVATFEKYLPHAIALGVENQWAKRFAGALAAAAHEQQGQNFAWYSGSHSPWTDPGGFTRSLGSAMTSTIASASTAPGSSSGSGGGGSSGGGGGGGGGGGW